MTHHSKIDLGKNRMGALEMPILADSTWPIAMDLVQIISYDIDCDVHRRASHRNDEGGILPKQSWLRFP